MIELFDYQKELVNKAREAYIQGYKAPCIVAPCGAGKSVMIAEIVRLATVKKQRVLFLVHRQELLDQINNTLRKNSVDMNYVTLGMVMTIVKKLNTYQSFDLIVVDENHHTLAKSYIKILDHYNTRVLGFTATPIRLNGDGLGDVNDVLIETVNAKWLIEHKRLAPYQYFSIDLIERSKLKKSSTGDYTNQSMDAAIGKTIFGDVVIHYQKIINGQKTILYAHSIEYSRMYAEQFNKADIPAEHIDGKTSKKERDRIIQAFRNNEIKVLCNVDLIGEGFDVPDCTAVMLLRPTASLSLHIQQSMRPMRYQPNKVATIIDHVGNVYIHGLPDMERTWTLEKKPKRKRKEVEAYPIWECKECFCVVERDTAKQEDGSYKCPECGYIDIVEKIKKQIDEEAELKRIQQEELEKQFYSNRDWRKAKSYKELTKIAKAKGYKTSWAAFIAKQLKLLDAPLWVRKYKSKYELKTNF